MPQDKPLILIVDDTPTNIQVLAEALRAEYRVKVAPSGKAAFAVMAKQGLPDLILLDVMMPEMDGYEVCRRLKQAPETRSIPVIFVTAKSDVVDEEQGLRLGAVDYITKPFHLPIVAARVRNHIDLKLKTDLLESRAMLDGLTNIPNRRRFDEALDGEWRRAQRSSLPLALVMVDIDFFKRYNDHYGHGAGDVCLKKVAAVLAECVARPSDLVARYGGEEFVMLLPETDALGAQAIAEHFRAEVEAMHLPHEDSDVSAWVTVSVGLAAVAPNDHGKGAAPNDETHPDRFPHPSPPPAPARSVPAESGSEAARSGETGEGDEGSLREFHANPASSPLTLLEEADRLLYRAKEAGRNRVCV